MTYKTLHDVEMFLGRLVAEEIARDYVAAERRHCAAVCEAIDEIERTKGTGDE